jgi:hypothetical protein
MKFKCLILDRDETIGNFDKYRTSGEIILNPGIIEFLEQACQENFITIMATGGISITIEELNKAAGIDHFFDYTFGREQLRTMRWWKDLSCIEKELGENVLDNAVMVGNQTDVYCCPYRTPIFQVNFDPGKEQWDTSKVYEMIKRLFENNTLPAAHFDHLFSQFPSKIEKEYYRLEEEVMPIADIHEIVETKIGNNDYNLEKRRMSEEKERLYLQRYRQFNKEEYHRRVIF